MIHPTIWVDVYDRKSHDLYGQPKFTVAGRERVCPVMLQFTDQQTTVRTDSSGSHGSARETIAKVRILAVPKTKIQKGDVLGIHGQKVVVTLMHPRYTVTGVLDHYELHCAMWV